MKRKTVPAIFAVVLLLLAPVIASAMTNIPMETKKSTSTPKQDATQVRKAPIRDTKTKEHDATTKDSNRKENLLSK